MITEAAVLICFIALMASSFAVSLLPRFWKSPYVSKNSDMLVRPPGMPIFRVGGLGNLFAQFCRPAIVQWAERIRLAIQTRQQVRYAIRLSQALEHELDFTPTADDFWNSFRTALRKAGLVTSKSEQTETENYTPVPIPFGSGGSARYNFQIIFAGGQQNGEKIARCFVPCLLKALKRFNSPWDAGLHLPVAPEPLNLLWEIAAIPQRPCTDGSK